VQDGVSLRAVPDLGVDRVAVDLPRRLDPVEAIGKPVVCAVVIDDDRREGRAVEHLLGVFVDGLGPHLDAHLRAAVFDAGDLDRHQPHLR